MFISDFILIGSTCFFMKKKETKKNLFTWLYKKYKKKE